MTGLAKNSGEVLNKAQTRQERAPVLMSAGLLGSQRRFSQPGPNGTVGTWSGISLTAGAGGLEMGKANGRVLEWQERFGNDKRLDSGLGRSSARSQNEVASWQHIKLWRFVGKPIMSHIIDQ